MQEYFYDVEIDGEFHNIEARSLEKAQEYADRIFSDICDENCIPYGETETDIALIIETDREDNILRTIEYKLSYTREKSDYEEHFNQSAFI